MAVTSGPDSAKIEQLCRCRTCPLLELRPYCECCDKPLPPSSVEAMICSFECTFCARCVADRLDGVCPNCGGGFARRPIRPQQLLEKYPASIMRRPLVCGNG